jgi:replicative DNA helicase
MGVVADVVMFIYRKAADRGYNIEELSDQEKTVAQIYIAKHRNGPTGKVNLFFDEETVSFKNLAKTDYDIPPELDD